MVIPRIGELVCSFKEQCHSRGWEASENEDWIRVDNEYHNFLWTRNIHPSSFKKIVSAGRCAIKQGISYKVVNVAYAAWLFPEVPPDTLVYTVAKDPKFAKRTALYDFSNVYAGKRLCYRFNETESEVFREFENFLTRKWEVEFQPALRLLKKEI